MEDYTWLKEAIERDFPIFYGQWQIEQKNQNRFLEKELIKYFSGKYPRCCGDFKIIKMENSTQGELNTRVPKLGETVIFFPNPDDDVARSNHAKVCVAIVTSPWSAVCANLKIVPDHGPMQDRGSVTHFSANPAGYHFMFQDEYEVYLKTQVKDYIAIKKQLLKEADDLILEAKEHLEKATKARVKAREKVTEAQNLKKP